jgi:hypothetical protein
MGVELFRWNLRAGLSLNITGGRADRRPTIARPVRLLVWRA